MGISDERRYSTTSGTVAAELSGVIVIIMGVITGVAGGGVRDILTAEIPLILRGGHLYATASTTGATLYLLLFSANVPRSLPTLIGTASVMLLRFASILWGLQLPVFALTGYPRERTGDDRR